MVKTWEVGKDWALELQAEKGRFVRPFHLEILLTGKEEDHHGLCLTLQVGPLYGCLNLYNWHHAEWFVTGREWAEGEEPPTLKEMAQNYVYANRQGREDTT